MLKKKRSILIAALTIFSFILLLVVLARGLLFAPSDEASGISLPDGIKNLEVSEKPVSSLYPSKLRIPILGIDAGFQYVGITRLGNMATPNNFKDVGWYKYGPFPGEKGSAVIAGHVDNGFALPAVFKSLQKIKEGDDIYVDRVDGTTLHFSVVGIDTYDYDAPTEGIFSQSDQPLLKLITCTGAWIPEKKTHDKRLVVTAMLK